MLVVGNSEVSCYGITVPADTFCIAVDDVANAISARVQQLAFEFLRSQIKQEAPLQDTHAADIFGTAKRKIRT